MFRFTISSGVLALTLWTCAVGAHAQTNPTSNAGQPLAAPAPDEPVTVSLVPDAPATFAPVPPPSILSVPLVPNARLRIDLDAQDEDVLGVTKSFLRGFNGSSLKPLVESLGNGRISPGPTIDAGGAAALTLLSDTDLQTLLENIHHLRIVAFETPRSYGNQGARSAKTPSVFDYYSQAYLTREGGRQVMRADFDDVQMLGVGFRDRGFAFVIQGPGFGAVVRADGYPNMESVGPLSIAIALALGARNASILR